MGPSLTDIVINPPLFLIILSSRFFYYCNIEALNCETVNELLTFFFFFNNLVMLTSKLRIVSIM